MTFAAVMLFVLGGFYAAVAFMYLPITPVTAVVIMAIDVLIISALLAHAEYFHPGTGLPAS
jgi:hypothetical protein